MIPPLDGHGLLPVGLHDADLEAVPAQFCTNAHRWRLWGLVMEGLDILCDLVRQHPESAPPALILGGSFFSDKPLPADIEATLVFPPGTPDTLCWFWTMQFGRLHAMLEKDHGLDFYPTLPGHGNDFALFFQYVGPKTAQEKGLHEKDPRGALRIAPW